MYENHFEKLQTAVLVGIDTGEYDAEYSMRELEGLAEASGAHVAAVMIKKRRVLEAATLLGSGAMAELREICRANEADLLIFDCELTPSQQRNIADLTDTAVIDRTMLILDIFAQRARSSEGRIQVELAQLKYMLPRLTGKGMSLSRLGGGIGTRGPGETKLETDRRHVRRRSLKPGGGGTGAQPLQGLPHIQIPSSFPSGKGRGRENPAPEPHSRPEINFLKAAPRSAKFLNLSKEAQAGDRITTSPD